MARQAVTARKLGQISLEVGIEGIAEINKEIAERLDRMTGVEAKKIWMRAALVVVREIRDNIHNITGTLSAGVFAAFGTKTKPNVLVGVSIGGRGKAPHGWVVEHGHGGPHPAPPHPYFKPGVQAARPMVGAIIAEGMKELAGR